MNRTKKNILSVIITLLLTACIGFTVYQIKSQNTPPAAPTGQMQQPGNNSGNGPGGAPSGNQPGNSSGSSNSDNDSASAKATASKTVSKSNKTLSGSYTSKKSDQSVVLVKNGGTLTLNNAVLNKLSGDSSNTENSEFYHLYKRNWISCDLLYR